MTNATSAPLEGTQTQVLKRQRVHAALANLFIGDALSMPVHWFYNAGDIVRMFGNSGITGFEDAPEHHPSSIMSLHSTSGGGRARVARAQAPEVVGNVILKGRAHLWGRANGHYHHGLRAGDNTLNAWWAKLLVSHLTDHESYELDNWVSAYIDFMTADPPQHPDTYAESCHRGFFANWAAGTPALQCGAITHDTPSMGALVTVAPLALALLASGLSVEQTCIVCRKHVWLTHPDEGLLKVVDAYVTLIDTLLYREDTVCDITPFVTAASVVKGTRLDKLLDSNKADNEVIGRTYSLACYITDSWPSVCYLAAKYHQDATHAMLRNTNLGGENAHRGSVLGTLIGLAGAQYPAQLYSALGMHNDLDQKIKHYLNKFYPTTAA